MYDTILRPAFRDLDEALDDFERAQYPSAESVLARFVAIMDDEPLSGFLRSVLPTVDFDGWITAAVATKGSMVGSGRLDWPANRPARVALQARLVREIVSQKSLFGFAHDFCYSGYNSISSYYSRFAEIVLRPFLRDLKRLAEGRLVPPILFEAMGALPSAGDAVLDQLLKDAVAKFRDAAPSSRKEGLERLWDAWERLKSLEHKSDKRISVGMLLDGAAAGGFRAMLEDEAIALTDIGNSFHIRHFETNREEIGRSAHVDYLFHRLFALIHLLLYSRTDRPGNE